MRLICPGCGGVHSAEAWISEMAARKSLLIVSKLPDEISRRCFDYLSFFRPDSGHGLRWGRTLSLLESLRRLLDAPDIRWKQKAPRPNAPKFWGEAMEKIIENPPGKLPLYTHGYLEAIAYEIADAADRKKEIADNKHRIRNRNHRLSNENITPINFEEMKKITMAYRQKRRSEIRCSKPGESSF